MKKTLLSAAFLLCLMSGKGYSQSALDFDGTDDYVQTTFSGITGSNARTVEAWIKTTANSAVSGQQVITDWGSATTGGRFTFNILTGNTLRIEVLGGGINGTKAVNDGQWHHVAVVYDPGATNKLSLYVDGQLDGSGNLTVNTTSVTPLRIGTRVDDTSKLFKGSISDVRVWNVARTASEIMANKDIQFCSPQANLVAYYKLNEGQPGADNSQLTITKDYSGSGKDGDLKNFTLKNTVSNWVSGKVLTQTGLDKTAVNDGNGTLTANQANATYQWRDCNNANAPIDNATGISFEPTATGSYAVEVSLNGCKAVSDCMTVSSTLGIEDHSLKNLISLYPNPTTGAVKIDLGQLASNLRAKIVSVTGQVISEKTFSGVSDLSLDIQGAKGVYFVHLDSETFGSKVFKIVKN